MEDNALDIKMTKIYERQNKAIKNWQNFGTYVHMLRSVGFNLVDRTQRQMWDQTADEKTKRAWYEGMYVISPTTIYYRLWDIFKSVLYMTSLYTLAYDAAFFFESGIQTAGFEMFIDLIQICDVLLTFFTAKRVRDLSNRVMKIKKREIQEQEAAQGINLKKAREVEWEINQKYLTIDYLITYFFLDLIAIVPFVIFIFDTQMNRMFLIMRFSRLFRIKRIL